MKAITVKVLKASEIVQYLNLNFHTKFLRPVKIQNVVGLQKPNNVKTQEIHSVLKRNCVESYKITIDSLKILGIITEAFS